MRRRWKRSLVKWTLPSVCVGRFAAGAGETIPIPGGREHTIRNESEGDASAFVVYSPGAEMEAFARAAARAGDGTPAIERVLDAAADHGIELTRPLSEPS